MIEICATADLKEFFITFMLYLIPILTYDAYSVIFTFQMKSPMPKIWPKVRGDPDHEEERFQVANRDPTEFYQRVLLATKKAI